MKTSNKLLFLSILIGISGLVIVQLSLYGKYKKGDIVSEGTLVAEGFTTFRPRAFPIVSIQGFQSVVVVPEDSFCISIEKYPGGRAGFFSRNDTLFILGDSLEKRGAPVSAMGQKITLEDQSLKKITLLDDYGPKLSNQQLILHSIPNQRYYFENGEVYLQGSTDSGKIHFEAEINHCVFNLSNSNYFDSAYQNRFYQSVTLRCRSGLVNLRSKTVVGQLNITLDDQSELVDNHAVIHYLFLGCTNKSRLQISGENLKKLSRLDY